MTDQQSPCTQTTECQHEWVNDVSGLPVCRHCDKPQWADTIDSLRAQLAATELVAEERRERAKTAERQLAAAVRVVDLVKARNIHGHYDHELWALLDAFDEELEP